MAFISYHSRIGLIFFSFLFALVTNVSSQRGVFNVNPKPKPKSKLASASAPAPAPAPTPKTNVTSQPGVSNVMNFGAKADGKTDAAKAILAAWGKVCASSTRTKLLIPEGIFFATGAVILKGPCKSHVDFQLDGTVKAPPEMSGVEDWVVFSYVTGLTITGAGAFDGQGASAWKNNQCHNKEKGGKCKFPVNLRFNFVTNATVSGISSIDSKLFHIALLGCKNIKFSSVKVKAPGTSVNTDGFHVAASKGVEILGGSIGTGDDCVSMSDGTDHLHVNGVHCGPGHGFSIGSLGKSDKDELVTGVHIEKCTITGTDNGVRIKTWPGGISGGTVSNCTFEDITVTNVKDPISINQEYCPYGKCNKTVPSKVKINGVRFRNIHGTSGTREVITLLCSKTVPSAGVELSRINIKYAGKDGPPTSTCKNVKPILGPNIVPPACTMHPPAV